MFGAAAAAFMKRKVKTGGTRLVLICHIMVVDGTLVSSLHTLKILSYISSVIFAEVKIEKMLTTLIIDSA